MYELASVKPFGYSETSPLEACPSVPGDTKRDGSYLPQAMSSVTGAVAPE
jgi:hypothetical protein